MFHSVQVLLILFSVVVALEAAASRIALPSPFLLLPAGILLGFVPAFPRFTLDPDLVLLAVLPPLVFAGAALGSWIEFRRSLRPILLLSIGCVLFTTAFVAVAAHFLIPGFGWAEACVLGAIVSPPDEVAAISIARRLGVPKGLSAVLEGEGLVNDATSLTVYRFAAAAVLTHTFSMADAAGSFLLVVFGEVAWGLFVGWLILRIRSALRSTSLEISLSLMTPFIAYLPAEALGGSGVLATVAAGLYVSYMHSRLVPATTRLQLVPIWQTIEFLLDGALFLVAGMQLHRILEPLGRADHLQLLAYGTGISALVIIVRMVWVFASALLRRAFGLALRPGEIEPTWQRLFLVSWSGMRGAISLAAAFSIPILTAAGAPFPQRDLMIFLTFSVIVSTLLLQGLSLPWLIRRLGIDREGRRELAAGAHTEVDARRRAAEASLKLLDERRRAGVYPEALLARLEDQYRERRAQFRAHLDGDHEGAELAGTHRFNVQTELIETEREVMLDLRGSGVIDDDVLRRIEKDLDLQEMRLRQGISEFNLVADQRHERT